MSLTPDTSVVVPALLSNHEAHDRCDSVLADVDFVLAHVLAESYSVLTRLPHPLRVPAGLAAEALADRTPTGIVALDAAAYLTLPARLSRAGISGGAVYDGVIALTAAEHDLELLSRDRRAARTYAALGVRHQLLTD